MRHWYTIMSGHDRVMGADINGLLRAGLTLSQAADYLGVSPQKAQMVLARSRVTQAELKARRKEYILSVLTNKAIAYRNPPHFIAAYFKTETVYVEQLIRELRAEGLLPKAEADDKLWQDDILLVLRRHYPNVFRSSTVNKLREVGDKVWVAGKGWLDWTEAKDLADKLTARKKS